jgi:trans-aconitate 2-methyltransferase
MAAWSDQQYLKFAEERTRPAIDLLARVPLTHAERVADYGCGPGNSSALLVRRFPDAEVVGVDDSPEMLARARRDFPEGHWVQANIATYQAPAPLDLLFANAALQWVPAHASLFPCLLQQVRPGGVFAVQMPQNQNEPSHQLMRETPPAVGARWDERSAMLRSPSAVEAPAFYYDLLASLATRLDIWQTTYQHVVPDVASIVEWVKGTGLRPYLDALTEAERIDYLARYTEALEQAYKPRADGRRLFPFKRLFIVVTR